MADPLSAAGVALSAVSLGFQVFSGCVKGYQLLIEAEGLPQKYEYLRLRLQLEQSRLLDWAVVAELADEEQVGDGDTIAGTWKLQKSTAIDALQQMEALFSDLENLKAKFGLTLAESHANDLSSAVRSAAGLSSRQHKLKQKALSFVAVPKKYPQRLRWVLFDARKLELLLSHVTAINDSMVYFLDYRQKRQHHAVQESTFVQVLQVHNKLDDVVQLVQSLCIPSQSPTSLTISDERHARLARFKALNLAIKSRDFLDVPYAGPDSGLQPFKSPKLDLSKLCVDESSESAAHRSTGTYDGRMVWMEWRDYVPDPSGRPPSYVLDRIHRLAILLHQDNSQPEFHTPKCVGYVHDAANHRLGFVFRHPPAHTSSFLATLRERISSIPKPPLTTRINLAQELATSLWYLHAADWVHKGVRSDNILITDEGDLFAPLLSGFDYARPIQPGEATDIGKENRSHDLYRHPDTQFDVPRAGDYGYKKVHDVYSLGVVLFEIGLWERVDSYLGLPSDGNIPRSLVKSVMTRLISDAATYRLRAEAGNIFADCVNYCLLGGGSNSDDGSGDACDLDRGVLEKLRTINM